MGESISGIGAIQGNSGGGWPVQSHGQSPLNAGLGNFQTVQPEEQAEDPGIDPGLMQLLASNPQLMQLAQSNPQILSALSQNPELASALQSNPQLLEAVSQDPSLLSNMPPSSGSMNMNPLFQGMPGMSGMSGGYGPAGGLGELVSQPVSQVGCSQIGWQGCGIVQMDQLKANAELGCACALAELAQEGCSCAMQELQGQGMGNPANPQSDGLLPATQGLACAITSCSGSCACSVACASCSACS